MKIVKKLEDYKKDFLNVFSLMEFYGNKRQLLKIIDMLINHNKEYHVIYEENEDY